MKFFLGCMVILFVTKLSRADGNVTHAKTFERLPTDVKPVNYALTFTPDLDAGTFGGKAAIDIEIQQKTKSITINSVGLNISDVKFASDTLNVSDCVDIEYNKMKQTVTFTFPNEIPEGSGILSMGFVGFLGNKLKGFYRSSYEVSSGQKRFSAATKFEPTDARMAFPCWDEPAFKATFDITLVVPSDRLALSNMPVKNESDDGCLKTVEFERSPIMSTYLVAMVVGEYDYVETTDANSVLIRVYTPLGKKEHGRFALDVANKTLPFFTEYFNISYPLPKLDLIALTAFASGAMENWGLVTFRETTLLVNPVDAPLQNKQRVAVVVGHELAHQWFGNLVTMEWWNDLWLNEGFASWAGYLSVNFCFPIFKIWNFFLTGMIHKAMEKDALKSSHPIEVEITDPSEVNQIFDEISYNKGASIIHMLHSYLGDEKFKEGLSLYLKSNLYNNTKTDDLWEAFTKVSNESIKEIMNAWTTKTGYPVITVEELVTNNRRDLNVSQERFIADGSAEDGNTTWVVPLVVKTSEGVKNELMKNKTEVVGINEKDRNFTLIINEGAVGFYRVQYVGRMLEMLLQNIQSFNAVDRLTFLNDLFALSAAGRADTVATLKFAATFSSERAFMVWNSLDNNLRALYIIYQTSDFIGHFERFLLKLYTPLMEYVGWDAEKNEDPQKTQLRNIAIYSMARYKNQSVIEEAKRRFNNTANISLSSDLRKTVYSIVLRNGDEAVLNQFIQIYKTAATAEDTRIILLTLGNTPTKELKQKVLNFTLGPDVPPNKLIYVVHGVADGVEGCKLAWQFVRDNWEDFSKKYSGFLLTGLIEFSTRYLVTEEDYNSLDNFFKKNPCPQAKNIVKQSLENIRWNILRLARDNATVGAFLNQTQSSFAI